MAGPRAPDVLLFDLGGVIVQLTSVPVFRRWTGNRLSDDEIWERWLRSPAVRRFESGRASAAHFGAELVREFELPVSAAEFLREFERWPEAPYPGALELLAELRDAFRLACLSNCNELHWPRFLDEMRLADAFDHHFASHELGALKPDVEVFERVASELGCVPERILFLDDNALNIEGARAAGLHAHRVLGTSGARALLEELGLVPRSAPLVRAKPD